jgi:endonuclease YncB( thermonuclease family)
LQRAGFFAFVGILAAGSIAAAGYVAAGETLEGPYEAAIVRVVDGDTLRVRARIWLGTDVELLVRIDGIDTPEIRGKCAREKELAARARAMTESLVAGGAVRLHDVRYGKYAGRIVARVVADGADIADLLLAAGLAHPYDGGSRAGWC